MFLAAYGGTKFGGVYGALNPLSFAFSPSSHVVPPSLRIRSWERLSCSLFLCGDCRTNQGSGLHAQHNWYMRCCSYAVNVNGLSSKIGGVKRKLFTEIGVFPFLSVFAEELPKM